MKHAGGEPKEGSKKPWKQVAGGSDDSRAYLRSIYDHSLDGMFLNKPETGEILYSNPAAQRMLGMTDGEVRKRGRDGILVQNEAIAEALRHRSEYGSWHGELMLRRKDGATFPVELSSCIFADPEGAVLSSMSFRDITDRRRADEALRESEEKYRAVVEHSNDGIIMVQDGLIAYANPKMAEIVGSTVERLIGSPIADHIDSADVDRIMHMHQRRMAGEEAPAMYEAILKHRDGGHVYADVNVSVTTYQRKPAGLAIIRDITERKRREEALKENESRLETVFSAIPDYVVEFDANRRAVRANEATLKALGLPLGYTLEQAAAKVRIRNMDGSPVTPDDLPSSRALRGEKFESSGEYRVTLVDGSERILRPHIVPIYREGKIDGTVGVWHDVTELKWIEEGLRRSRDELEQRVNERTFKLKRQAELLDIAHDAIVVRDLENRIIVWNRGAEQMYGHTKEEAIGKDAHLLLKTRGKLPSGQIFKAILEEGYWEGELVRLRKDGREICVLSRAALQRDEEGNPFAVMDMTLDMTEQKKIEERLRQAHKMEGIGTLAGGIAHDFNNILAIIVGNVELSIDDVHQGQLPEHNLNQILKAALRGRDLVKKILTFSRKTKTQMKPVGVASVLSETFKLLRASIPTNIDMSLDIQDPSATILGDPVEVQQIIMNLSANSAYAMRKVGGQLTIRLGETDFNADDELPDADLKHGRYIKLLVQDTGAGMNEEVRSHVFEPFFTTKKSAMSAGMGLPVTYGIVKSYNGAITVESKVGKGTVFTVYLPKIESPAEKEAPEKHVDAGNGERILFIDDEQAIVDVAGAMLRKLGYTVTTMCNAKEALEGFLKDPYAFDVVITDQTMPDATGVVLARKMLRARPDIPIILCTGYSEMASPEKAKSMGIREFVMKPLVKSEVAEVVRRALDSRR